MFPRALLTAIVAVATVLPFAGCATSSPAPGAVRINQAQVIGSHNSYRQRAHPSITQLLEREKPGSTASLDYTHPPLAEQFSRLGVRQIELDIFPDPQGGKFANPNGPARAKAAGLPDVPSHDPQGKLRQPGYKVLHMVNTDYFTSALTLKDALTEVRDWSLKNPRHFPMFVLLEVKNTGPTPTDGTPRHTLQDLNDLEAEILSVFQRSHILTPDNVRGSAPTLRDAVLSTGWPSIDQARGKVVFLLDNEDPTRDLYLRDAPTLQNRLIFTSVPRTHPAAGWMKMNDVIKDYEEIKSLVRDGFLVRTRTDVGTTEARANDPKRRDLALSSGAQFVSTDYAEPDPRFSSYRVRFEGGIIARSNPVSGPRALDGIDLER